MPSGLTLVLILPTAGRLSDCLPAGWLIGVGLAQTIVIQANTAAFRDGFLVVAIVFAIALLPTWLLHRAEARRRV